MNTFVILQQTATSGATGGNWTFLIMMAAIFVVMYFLMIRPQKKRQKELKEYRDNLKKGDKVITAGGIYGTIAEVKENYVLLEVCLLYTSPSPRDRTRSRMPSSA